ncbi:cytochrome P450 [Microbispora amethystogenes]|uniref:Cytochrome P450 n=1 Tax=Microbispora amethystogenes TaxID=1427754 RepID=A0ABQ4F9A3_9ACTN|nr:cytochrome P450 [Microbispora amethystogenes]
MTPDIWPVPAAEDLASMPLESLLTREYQADPARVHERLRAAYGPVAPIELHGVPVWFAFGYDEVRYIMQNPDEFWSKHVGHWRAFTEGRIPADWPLIPLLSADNSGFHDGDRHRGLRGAWIAGLREFQEPGGEHTQKLERAILKYCDDLIGVMTEGAPTGWADLAAQYGRPLPLMVANHLLGVTLDRGEEMIMDQWRLLDGPDAAGAYQRLNTALLELATAKRHRPGHDLPSAMFAAAPALTPEEVARELFMLSGFLDFTGSLICNVILEAVGNPNLRTSVTSGQIEELVNRVALLNPALANLTFRYARTTVKLGRFTIAAGDPVMLSISGAHADPLFASALNRDTVRSTRAHLAWGAGPHRCPSQRLATQMCTIAVRRLLDRFSALTLATPPEQLPWRPSPFVRALRSLPVRFEVNPNAVPVSRPGQATAGQEPPPEETDADGWRPPARSGFWTFLRKLRRAP